MDFSIDSADIQYERFSVICISLPIQSRELIALLRSAVVDFVYCIMEYALTILFNVGTDDT
jgi:hypothetical protein